LAQIALGSNAAAYGVHCDCAERADHDAGPAADAFFLVVDHQPAFLVAAHGSRKARRDARGVLAVSALDGERDWLGFGHFCAAEWFGLFFFVGFNEVFGLRMLDFTVDFAQAASHAVFFEDKDFPHRTSTIA